MTIIEKSDRELFQSKAGVTKRDSYYKLRYTRFNLLPALLSRSTYSLVPKKREVLISGGRGRGEILQNKLSRGGLGVKNLSILILMI